MTRGASLVEPTVPLHDRRMCLLGHRFTAAVRRSVSIAGGLLHGLAMRRRTADRCRTKALGEAFHVKRIDAYANLEPMLMDESSRVASTVLDAPKKSEADQLLERFVLRDPYQDFWSNVVLWTSLAESLVPLVLLALDGFPSSRRPASSLMGLVICWPRSVPRLGSALRCCLPLRCQWQAWFWRSSGSLVRPLRFPCNNLPIGTLAGGFVGILLVMPFVFSSERPLWILSIPVLLGQAGGAYGAWRTFHRPRRVEAPHATIRFGIKQLMILTAWLAVLMTLLKLAGLTEWTRLQTLGTFFVLQVAATFAAWMWDRRT